MAMFDDAMKNAVPGGNLATPIAVAVGALLLGKFFGGSSAPTAAPGPARSAPPPSLPTNVPPGSVLGGLGDLIGKLTAGGAGPQVNSWVGPGANPELVLLRRPPGRRRGRRPEGAVRPGRAARPDDDRFPRKSADAGDLPRRRALRHRARRPSAVLDPVPVRHLSHDDDRLRRARCVPPVTRAEMKTIKVGSGAGYSGDRIEPAVELAEKGGLDYLVFECLAERTIALAQQVRMKDPSAGYDPLLAARGDQLLVVPWIRRHVRL